MDKKPRRTITHAAGSSPTRTIKPLVPQVELKAILDVYNSLGTMILDIRRRLHAGEAAEAGSYTVKSNPKIPIDLYEEAWPITRLGMWGLEIEQQSRQIPMRALNYDVISAVRKDVSKGTRTKQSAYRK